MGDIAIEVENLSKVYRIGVNEQRHETMFGALAAFVKSPLSNFRNLRKLSRFDSLDEEDIIWALKDVSFKVKQGEVVGIIGHNGAGKSTLLKILSRITEPTSGAAYVHGRVGSLLEVGTGFHPDLTGRENVYLNGTILGMKKKEIDRKFDEIVDFSGVEHFLDTPVKRYSSGMRVRLAFSVAAHLEPELLVVDEVLAVGDLEFQKKCLGKIDSVAKSGRTVLFVSHSTAAITGLCSRAIQLIQGRIADDGSPDEVVRRYVAASSQANAADRISDRTDREGTGGVRITKLRFHLCDGRVADSLVAGKPGSIDVVYAASDGLARLGKLSVSITISTMDGQNLVCLWDRLVGGGLSNLPPVGTLRCSLFKVPLMPGRYRLMVTMTHDGELVDRLLEAADLMVVEGTFYESGALPPSNLALALVEHSWAAMP
jgi:lipopolysaccharide transport system ATP-binding protein